jgi:predicted ArsR family transcriptional regulator
VGEDRPKTSRRVTVAEAAEILGVSVEAVRGRIKRGTLEAERTPEGVFVLLAANQSTDQGAYQTVSAAEFIEEMRDRIRDLREQLASERRANEENRRIIAALTQRIPEIEAPASPETRESPETPSEDPYLTHAPPTPERPFTEEERASQERQGRWWRRFFGLE